jgi:hypothetical protein
MKRKVYIALGVIIILGVAGYLGRHWFMDYWDEMHRPKLPPALAYQEEGKDTSGQMNPGADSPVEGGLSASQHYVLESSPQTAQPPVDPLAIEVKIPDQINLNVPWMSQAPKADWSLPYQEACEEASMIMVDGFYRKQMTRFAVDDADSAIRKLVDYEVKMRGDYKDTDAQETAKILEDYFGYEDVRVLPFKTIDDIKKIVGRGYPVIVPFHGKALQNPNYHNGGPLYHMLVIKGYTDDGLFITCDPGTRKGEDYTYPFTRIVDAAHDWNGGDVEHGDKVMIVVMPNE